MYTNGTNASGIIEHSSHNPWKTHWILFSILFFITGCFTTALLFKAIQRTPELTRNYRLSVFTMVIILCLSRTVYLLLDPYEVGKALASNTPVLVLRLIYALGQPSLTAGFGFVHASFLKVAKAKHYQHESLLKTRTILLIVGLYFTFGVITEIVTVFLPGMTRMLVVSASLTVVGCGIITITVSYSGLRILRKATENNRVLKLSRSSLAASRDQLQKAKSIAKVARITLAAATFCIGLTIANSIAFVKMFNSMSSVTHWSSEWQFITFVTCVRLLEIAMALTLIYALSHTNMKLKKMLGRFSRRLRPADTWTVKNTNEGYADGENMKNMGYKLTDTPMKTVNGYADTWRSTSSISSANSTNQFIN